MAVDWAENGTGAYEAFYETYGRSPTLYPKIDDSDTKKAAWCQFRPNFGAQVG
jgi:hypothetical protein